MYNRVTQSSESSILGKMHARGEHGYFSDNEEFNKIIVGWRQLTPRYRDFISYGVYSREEIEKDKKYVDGRKRSFKHQAEKNELVGKSDAAISIEPVVMEGIYNYGWLGENVSVMPAKEYDDIANGVDLVVAFGEGDDTIQLAIDTTKANDKTSIEAKLRKNIDNINELKLTEVKYYHNEDTGEEPGKKEMPRVVVGLDKEEIKRLQDAMVNHDKELANDEVKFLVMEEIKNQLAYSMDFLIFNSKLFGYTDYYENDNPDEILAFVDEHQEELKTKPDLFKVVRKHYDALKVVNEEIKKSPYDQQSIQTDYFAHVINYDNFRKMEWDDYKGRPSQRMAA